MAGKMIGNFRSKNTYVPRLVRGIQCYKARFRGQAAERGEMFTKLFIIDRFQEQQEQQEQIDFSFQI